MLSGGQGWAKAWKNQRSEVFRSPEIGMGLEQRYKDLDTEIGLRAETLRALKSFGNRRKTWSSVSL